MNGLRTQELNHSSVYYKKHREIIGREEGEGELEEEEKEEMKAVRSYPRPEPKRVGNGLIITSMILSLCILSLIKTRYISSPFGKSQDLSDRSRRLVSRGEEDEGNRVLLEELREAKRPICVETSRRSDVCEVSGDVRVHGSSQAIFVDRDLTSQEWKIKPYARKHDKGALANVKEWTIKAMPDEAPQCTDNHSVPAVVFSVGGYTGNLFHDFTDVLVPLFLTTRHFRGEVQFVVTDAKAWWLIKFSQVLRQLSNYEIIDADADGEAVRCFPRVVAGLTFHKELGIDPAKSPNGYAMADFKAMLREAYGLERAAAEPAGDKWDVRRKPRLLIISRKGSRVFLNERGMSDMAMSLGFDVRVADPDVTTDIGKFARLVNSADVLIGVHGSGLTNVVFLPRGAVFIQVVPMGNLGWLARDTFENPSPEMELKYSAYRIQADESTLSDQYPKDHPVFTDPQSIHKKGWGELSRIYLNNQDLKPHLGRLRLALLEALKLLPHGHAMAQ